MAQTYREVMQLTLEGGQDVVRTLEDVRRASSDARRELSTAQTTTGDAGKAFTQLDRAVGQAASGMGQASGQTSLLERALGALGKTASTVTGALGGIAGAVGGLASGVFSGLATAVTGLTGAAVGLGGVGLNSARRIDNLNAALRGLSSASGISMDALNDQVRGIEDLNIDAGTARNAVVRMTQANLDLSKATDLVAVAQDASVISGMQTADVLDSLVHGIVTQNSLVLRNAGITIDAQKAQDDYATSLGVSAKSLTANQKQQAVMNAVLREGTNIAGIAKEAQDPIAAMGQAVSAVATTFGVELLTAIKPAAESLFLFLRAVASSDALRVLAKLVGETLAGALRSVSPLLERLTGWIKGIDTATAEAGLGRLTGALGKLTPIIGPLAGALLSLGTANIAGMLGPLGAIIPTLNPVVGAFLGLAIAVPEVRDAVSAFFQAFTGDPGALGVIGDLIERAFGPQVAAFFRPLLQGLMDFLRAVQEGGGWLAYFARIWEGTLLPAITNVWGFLQRAVLPILEDLASFVLNKVVPALSDLAGWLAQHVVPTLAVLAGWLAVNLIPAFIQLAGALIDLLTPAFRALGPPLEAVFGFIRDLIGPIERNEAVVSALATAIGVAAGAFVILQTAMAIQGLISAVGAAITAFQLQVALATAGTSGLSAAMALLNAVFMANPIGIIVVALAALVAGLIWAYNNVEWFRDGVNAAWDAIKKAAGVAFDFIKEHFDWFLVAIGPIGWAILALKNNWDSVKSAVQGVWDFLTGFFSWLGDQIAKIPSLPDWMTNPASAARGWVENRGMPSLPALPAPVGIADNGGILAPGSAALNLSGRPEYVLSPGSPMPAVAPGGEGTGRAPVQVSLGGIVINSRAQASPAFVDEIARLLAPALERELQNMPAGGGMLG